MRYFLNLRNYRICTLTLAAVLFTVIIPLNSNAATRLRCEYADSPLGIDNPHPRLSWVPESGVARGWFQSSYRILAASRPGLLKIGKADLWDSGTVRSRQTIGIEYQGRPLQSGQRVYWTVFLGDPARSSGRSDFAWWEMGLLRPADWKARWIGREEPSPIPDSARFGDMPAPLLRKEFTVVANVKRARAYVTGLGYYELSLNGTKVGQRVLEPGWTAYAKRVPYAVYDVTNYLKEGRNAAGVMLGNGWYNPLPLHMWGHLNLREHLTVGAPIARVQIVITYENGKTQSIFSDTSWRASDGPIRRNSVYLGEKYDARCEQAGWDRPGFDDRQWRNAIAAPEPGGAMTAQTAPPIRITRRFSTRTVTQPKPGVYLFDLGQNFAGWATLRVRGATAGKAITLRYGELTYPDGSLNPMTSVTGQIKGRRIPQGSVEPSTAVQTETYICKGAPLEVYTPRFTFHGFRYVEVTGYPGAPPRSAIEGLGLNSDVERVGDFECSNPLLNNIQTMTRNTFLSNLFSVQSDCPHREKFGYGGDIVATSETAMLNFDMARFYEKSILDLADSVRANGGFTETAPYVGIADAGLGDGAGPVEWGTAHPQLVWQRYVMYGDRQTLREQYPMARRWFALLQSKAVGYILDNGISDHESLAEKPTALTGTSFFYYNADLLRKMARALGRIEEAKAYEQTADKIRDAFNQRFLAIGTGKYGTGTQASQTIALEYGLVYRTERDRAIDVLMEDVFKAHDGHLTTGIFGTPALLDVLTDSGHADAAYKVASQETFPSWGWMLKNGATTLWEHWEFSDNTYSHNHPMFGSVSGWFFKSLAGIAPAPDAVGFDKIVIRPHVDAGLSWAKGSYRSERGMVRSEWSRQGPRLQMHVLIPCNTSATVFVPAGRKEDVYEGMVPAHKAQGVRFVRILDGSAIYEVGSGDYHFTAMQAAP